MSVEEGPLMVGSFTLDAYAGAGGWDEGLRWLGRTNVLGLEWNEAACATASAAGHRRSQVDVSRWRPETLAGPVDLLVGSPPCPTFSLAGSGIGRRLLAVLADAIAGALAGRPWVARSRRRCHRIMARDLLDPSNPRSRWPRDRRHRWAAEQVQQALQVVQPARLIHALNPRAVALEQVVPVLPLWKVYAHHLRTLGYSVAVGKLNAADYGVPQTRERAILVARRDGQAARLPAATHARATEEPTLLGPGRERWVSMAEALGAYDERWAALVSDRPGRTICGQRSPRWLYGEGDRSYDTGWTVRTSTNTMRDSRETADMVPYERPVDAPAPTVDSKAAKWTAAAAGAHRVTPQEARALLETGRGTGHATPDGRQRIDPSTNPAPTVLATSGSGASGWVLRNNTSANAAERTADQPAPTVYFGRRLNGGWVLRPNSSMPEDRTLGRTPDEPAPTLASWALTRPATTVQGDARIWPPGHKASTPAEQASGRYGDRAGTDALRIEAWQAGVLQSFPPDYPWQGNRTQQYGQVGDAVPPALAAAVLGELLGARMAAAS